MMMTRMRCCQCRPLAWCTLVRRRPWSLVQSPHLRSHQIYIEQYRAVKLIQSLILASELSPRQDRPLRWGKRIPQMEWPGTPGRQKIHQHRHRTNHPHSWEDRRNAAPQRHSTHRCCKWDKGDMSHLLDGMTRHRHRSLLRHIQYRMYNCWGRYRRHSHCIRSAIRYDKKNTLEKKYLQKMS